MKDADFNYEKWTDKFTIQVMRNELMRMRESLHAMHTENDRLRRRLDMPSKATLHQHWNHRDYRDRPKYAAFIKKPKS